MLKNLFAKKANSQKAEFQVWFMGHTRAYFVEAHDKKQVDRIRAKEGKTHLYTLSYNPKTKQYA
jgi:hypothetical protein